MSRRHDRHTVSSSLYKSNTQDNSKPQLQSWQEVWSCMQGQVGRSYEAVACHRRQLYLLL